MKHEALRILIVDDDAVDRMATRRALQKAGLLAEIEEATESAQALATLQGGEFDCALLDYQLPGCDGIDILRKAHAAGINTPIIILTGHGDEVIAVEAMKAGAADYLSKGRLSPETLARSVRAVARIHEAEQQTYHAEEARRESESRFRVMADSAPVLIWMSDAEGGSNYYNQGWLDFTGRALEEELAADWSRRLHPDDLTRCLDIYKSAFTARHRFKMEYRMLREDGEYRWIFDTGVPRFQPDGSFAGFIGSCVDITERKQVEESLIANQAHIAALNQELRQTMSVMHDRVRNTLQILAAMVDLMTFHSGETIPCEDIQQLGSHIHIMATVQDLLTQQAKTDGKASTLSAGTILDRLIPLFQSMAKRSKLETQIEEVRLPAQQGIALPVVVNEILANAFKHGKNPGGTVVLSLSRNETEAVVQVTDDGPGFPPDFDPILSAHMGLELIERLSRWDLKGQTRYENRPEGGAQVTVTIPLSSEAN